jgi:hypothetical protein
LPESLAPFLISRRCVIGFDLLSSTCMGRNHVGRGDFSQTPLIILSLVGCVTIGFIIYILFVGSCYAGNGKISFRLVL